MKRRRALSSSQAALFLLLALCTASATTQQSVDVRSSINSTSGSDATAGDAAAIANRAKYTVAALFEATGNIKIAPAVLAVVALIVGLGMCAFGYRLFRVSVFVCGFIGGGLAVSRTVENVFAHETYLVTASWISFFFGGILIGCIVMSLYYAGIFVVGAACGVLLAVTFNAGVGHKIYANNPDSVLLALAIILGIVGGMAAVCLEKPALIVITSFIGSALSIWGVGYFAGDFPSGDTLNSFRANTKGDTSWLGAIPPAWWGYFVALLVLTSIGIAIQRLKTGKDGYYDSQHGFVKNVAPMHRGRFLRYQRNGYGDVQTPSPTRHNRTQTQQRSRQQQRRPRSQSSRRRLESDYIV
ncbi:hypothetical protein Gpo141_00007433 [Globisporangium polare]